MTLYSSDSIIDYCLDKEFKYHSIKDIRHFIERRPLYPIEALVSLTTSGCKILNINVPSENAWKINFILQFLNHVIKKYSLQLNCKAIVNMNDGVPADEVYTRLAWHRHRHSTHICVPDPLTCGNLIINNKISEYRAGDIPFENKKLGAFFRGADTGKFRKNFLNQRVKMCDLLKDSTLIDAKISYFAHYNEAILKEHGIDINEISVSVRSAPHEQLQYKYILYMHGNSVSPDRIIWNLDSNSIVVQPRPQDFEMDYTWACSFIYDHDIILLLGEDDFEENLIEVDQRGDLCHQNQKQQEFAKAVLDLDVQEKFLCKVLSEYNRIYNS